MEKEIVVSVGFGFNETKEFVEPDSKDFYSRQGQYEVEFLFMEIKSDQPPTDAILKIQYYTNNNNAIKYKNIEFIKYRKLFQFENGYYILYLNEVEELKEKIIPIKMTFGNKRDTKSIAQLFYRVRFQV